MRSMTGYGRGAAERPGWRVVVELRSVNHRFIDLKLRGTPLEPAVEDKLARKVRTAVDRGAITVTSRVVRSGSEEGVAVDVPLARKVAQQLRELCGQLNLDTAITLDLVCSQPGVVTVADLSHGDGGLLSEALLAAADEALRRLLAMRSAEGATLAGDLTRRFDRLTVVVDRIAEHAKSARKKRSGDFRIEWRACCRRQTLKSTINVWLKKLP